MLSVHALRALQKLNDTDDSASPSNTQGGTNQSTVKTILKKADTASLAHILTPNLVDNIQNEIATVEKPLNCGNISFAVSQYQKCAKR